MASSEASERIINISSHRYFDFRINLLSWLISLYFKVAMLADNDTVFTIIQVEKMEMNHMKMLPRHFLRLVSLPLLRSLELHSVSVQGRVSEEVGHSSFTI